YVSNADDGDIGIYAMQADGSLQPGPRVAAAKVVMPMAVSPDKRFLIAAVRSKPYEATPTRSTGAREPWLWPARDRSRKATPTSRSTRPAAISSARPTARTRLA